MQRRGFTLIELLVVIAIIAILAAILFPVFAQVRAKARQTACISNIRQCWLGLTMYRDDYDGFYPYGVDVNPMLPPDNCNRWNVSQAIFTWEGPRAGLPYLNECIMFGTAFPVWLPEADGRRRPIIEPYLKSDRIYYCPNVPECWVRGNCPNPFVEGSFNNGTFHDPARTRGRSSYYYPNYDFGAFFFQGVPRDEARRLAAENLIWGKSSYAIDDRVRILLDNYVYSQRHIQGGNIATMVVVHPTGNTKVWKWQP
ncbi:MAG: prepilin-type N-terminal cleavage/methylation domain-containing protein [Armatimonadota bacterium]|nr:prepilin-type N-terminal cleavage/methylation domain-containing protein [Armatimonadota bacterium]